MARSIFGTFHSALNPSIRDSVLNPSIHDSALNQSIRDSALNTSMRASYQFIFCISYANRFLFRATHEGPKYFDPPTGNDHVALSEDKVAHNGTPTI